MIRFQRAQTGYFVELDRTTRLSLACTLSGLRGDLATLAPSEHVLDVQRFDKLVDAFAAIEEIVDEEVETFKRRLVRWAEKTGGDVVEQLKRPRQRGVWQGMRDTLLDKSVAEPEPQSEPDARRELAELRDVLARDVAMLEDMAKVVRDEDVAEMMREVAGRLRKRSE